jgi:hypothetical protein
MIVLTGVVFLTNFNIAAINPNNVNIINQEGSFIENFDAGDNTLDTNLEDKLPDSSGSVSGDSGGVFTDIWQSVKNWFIQKTYWLNAISGVVPNYFKTFGFSKEISFTIGFIWLAIAAFMLVNYFKGGR